MSPSTERQPLTSVWSLKDWHAATDIKIRTRRPVARYCGTTILSDEDCSLCLSRTLSGRPARSSARDATSRPNHARARSFSSGPFLAHLRRRLPNYFGRDQFALSLSRSPVSRLLPLLLPSPDQILIRGGGFLIFDIADVRALFIGKLFLINYMRYSFCTIFILFILEIKSLRKDTSDRL